MERSQEQGRFPGGVALETVRAWTRWLTEVERRIGAQCARREARWHAGASLRGLLSPGERKNGWQIAASNGETTPYGGQHLLGRAQWDADALRDDVRPSVVEHLGASQAVLVVDETGLLKKGQHSAGVARHESGTAGRVANCQLGVFWTSAGPQGHGMLERELSLPKAWTNDAARCQGAGMPAARLLATKPQRAQQRLQRAFAQGVPAAWVTGDRVYGAHRSLRLWLEEHPHAHVLAISGKASVWRAGRPQQVKTILAAVAAAGWCRWRAGDGAKGPRG
jgi:SRSO17 transposase